MQYPLSTAEKYELDKKIWVNITNQMPNDLYCVIVCKHYSGLYLSGNDPQYGITIIHFNLNNETFTSIRSDSSFYGYSLLCCLDNQLYHIKPGTEEAADLTKESIAFEVK
jgi:hypothetical protein